MGFYKQETDMANVTSEEGLDLLILRAKVGDLDAFEVIVRRFQDMAVGYAYSVLGDFHLAQDAAQEAFVEAYRDLARVYGAEVFSTSKVCCGPVADVDAA